MKILSIKESGSNNILRWAIEQGAEIKSDIQLCGLINNDLFYLVELSEVNFFELFRLTQLYRNKLKVISEEKAEVPNQSELMKYFSGECSLDPNEPEKKSPAYEIAEYCISTFINLALQMNTDDDIISLNGAKLFIPMIARKFTIQLPISFLDITQSMSDDEGKGIFNENYPKTFDDILLNDDNHNIKNVIKLLFIKTTGILSYNKRYMKYLKITKYSALNTYNDPKSLYRFALIGFYKFNNATKGEVRFELFNPDQNSIADILKKLSVLNEPLNIEFAVQLPLQYMQILENYFDVEDLPVLFESSMADIIDGDIRFNDFNTWDPDEDLKNGETPNAESLDIHEKRTNQIAAYKTRISEANKITLNAIPLLLNDPDNVDETNTFAMLPSAYTTKAVLVLNLDKKDKYLGINEPLLAKMFNEMFGTAEKIIEDIDSSNK